MQGRACGLDSKRGYEALQREISWGKMIGKRMMGCVGDENGTEALIFEECWSLIGDGGDEAGGDDEFAASLLVEVGEAKSVAGGRT